MSPAKLDSTMSAAASRLRGIICTRADGDFLGGEAELQRILGVSRTTLRQVARLLEREGLLRVRRGGNGGYYACRPSFGSMEVALIAHLEALDVRIAELLAIASITWAEAVEQAASLNSEASRTLSMRLGEQVRGVSPDISSRALIELEQEIRAQVFALIDSPYMQLIFEVNVRFAQVRFKGPGPLPDVAADQSGFVAAWRAAKLLELEAIAQGDVDLGSLAARRTREIWTRMMRVAGDAQDE